MNLNKMFRTFKQKLLCENLLKALLIAFTFSFTAIFLISLVYHILIKETPLTITYITGGVIFLIVFFVVFIVGYPTKKRIAIRIDEIGLQERVSTMLEFQNENTEMIKMQRKDAEAQISKVTSKNLKMRVAKHEFILCAVSFFMAVAMLLLPYNAFAIDDSSETPKIDQEQIVKDLIEELREKVKESELSEEIKKALDEIIDEMEEELKDTENEIERAAKIEQAKQKMEELLEKALTKKAIGEALQEYELTRELGEAISEGDTEKVSLALNALEEMLSKDKEKVSELAQTLVNALDASGAEEDPLYVAINDFCIALLTIKTEQDSFKEELTEAFDDAERAILSALKEQAAIEEEKEKIEETLSDAKDKVLGNEKEEESNEEESDKEEEKSEGEEPNGEKPEGEVSDRENHQGGGEQLQGGGEDTAMTEGIYDPVLGNVSYGEVFAAYYADYLRALEEGEVPEDLQEIVDKYFSSLN